jgi:hypothetical protein
MSVWTQLRTVEEIGKASGGYAVESDGAIYVPVVMMPRQREGDGGRFLDALPRDRTIKFPCVISHVLEGMLQRRGFSLTYEWSPEFGEMVPVYVREAVSP